MERNHLDYNHRDADDKRQSFILIHEPHIILPTNNEDRRVDDIESSPNIQTLDENIIQRSAAEKIAVNLTLSDSLTQMPEGKVQNVTLLVDENKISLMASKGHWETNSLLRDNEKGWRPSQRQRESFTSVSAIGTGNIIYGSDQRIYRIHQGPPGAIGPQGRRVSIF